MPARIRIAAIAICLALTLPPGQARAQTQSSSADVTFVVPLNLTNLASDVTRVRVRCEISSGSLYSPRTGEAEVAVAAGQVVTTLQVVVLIPVSAIDFGKLASARYDCSLSGFTPSFGWQDFLTNSTNPSYRLPSPSTGTATSTRYVLTGSFNW